MKTTYLLLSIVTITFSSFTIRNVEKKHTYSSKIAVVQPSEGEKLISKMDCVGCHKLDKKLVGPSYLDIAQKYDMNNKNINYLSSKIIKGGAGVWGSVPMLAHTNISKDVANKMAKYILSLKK